MSDNKITIYGAEWCPPCHVAKQYLKSKKIGYDYIDVDKVEGAAQKATELSGQRAIPIIDIDGSIVVGFDRPTIDHLLETKQLV